MIYRPKKHGGLGVLNLRIQNDAMLLKFLHKFYNRHDISWVKLIWDTYYNNSASHASELCGSFWWCDVMQLSQIFRGVTTFHIRSGDTTLF